MATLYLHAAFIDAPIISCSCAPPTPSAQAPTPKRGAKSSLARAPRQRAKRGGAKARSSSRRLLSLAARAACLSQV